MEAFAQQARARLSADDQVLRLHVDWDLAVAHWLRGRLAEAEAGRTRLVAEQQAADEVYLAVRPSTPSRSTSVTFWPSWARPTGPRRSCGHASWD
jgi:hypothetical protein